MVQDPGEGLAVPTDMVTTKGRHRAGHTCGGMTWRYHLMIGLIFEYKQDLFYGYNVGRNYHLVFSFHGFLLCTNALCKHLLLLQSEMLVTQSCLTLCDPMDCSLPGFSVYGISQARILEWVAISSFRGSSRDLPRFDP